MTVSRIANHEALRPGCLNVERAGHFASPMRFYRIRESWPMPQKPETKAANVSKVDSPPAIAEKVRFWQEQDRINQALIPRVVALSEQVGQLSVRLNGVVDRQAIQVANPAKTRILFWLAVVFSLLATVLSVVALVR